MAAKKKLSPEELTKCLTLGQLPFAPIALTGPSGCGKSHWLRTHFPTAVCVNGMPKEEELEQMKKWRLHHLLKIDSLLIKFIDEELSWRCPGCKQLIGKSSYATLAKRLVQDFSSLIQIGFPYSGAKETLVRKGYWRIMTTAGALPLPPDDWIEADILIDRLDVRTADSARLSDAVEQSLIEGLGMVVVLQAGLRYSYGARFYCGMCHKSEEAFDVRQLTAWSQGKSDGGKQWDEYEWLGVGLKTFLMRSPIDWIREEKGCCSAPWWPVLKERFLTLDGLGLGALSLGRSLNTLSYGERTFLIVGRCLEWRSNGQDFILDHPDAGLDSADQGLMGQIMDHLVASGNRVWLESRSQQLIKKCSLVVVFGEEPRKPDDDVLNLSIEPMPENVVGIRRRIKFCEQTKQGVVLLSVGARSSGKSRRLMSVYTELKKSGLNFFRRVEFMDTDPWAQASNQHSLIEMIGLWSWLTEMLVNGPEAKRMRLLPSHFDKSTALGSCSFCRGEAMAGEGCLVCGGTGIERRVLSLDVRGTSVKDLWQYPLDSVNEGILSSMPYGLRQVLQSLHRIGLATLPGKYPVARLSFCQFSGLCQLLFLLNNKDPSILCIDEPFRCLDSRISSEILTVMKRKTCSGSMIICVSSAPLDLKNDGDQLKKIGKRA